MRSGRRAVTTRVGPHLARAVANGKKARGSWHTRHAIGNFVCALLLLPSSSSPPPPQVFIHLRHCPRLGRLGPGIKGGPGPCLRTGAGLGLQSCPSSLVPGASGGSSLTPLGPSSGSCTWTGGTAGDQAAGPGSLSCPPTGSELDDLVLLLICRAPLHRTQPFGPWFSGQGT